jgi:hypothetical protein
MSMSARFKWFTPKDVKFTHALIDGIGHLELVDGVWQDKDGKAYDLDFTGDSLVVTGKPEGSNEARP